METQSQARSERKVTRVQNAKSRALEISCSDVGSWAAPGCAGRSSDLRDSKFTIGAAWTWRARKETGGSLFRGEQLLVLGFPEGGVESRTVPGRFVGFLLTGAMTGVLLQQGLEIVAEIPTGSLFAASKSDEEWCIVFSTRLMRMEGRGLDIQGLTRWRPSVSLALESR